MVACGCCSWFVIVLTVGYWLLFTDVGWVWFDFGCVLAVGWLLMFALFIVICYVVSSVSGCLLICLLGCVDIAG